MPTKKKKSSKSFHPTASSRFHTVDSEEMSSVSKKERSDHEVVPFSRRMSFYLGLFVGFMVVQVVALSIMAITA